MAPLIPNFLRTSKKTSSKDASSKLPSWQRSGEDLRREGARAQGAVTSIHNVSRKKHTEERDQRAVSSIARARQEESERAGHHHAGHQTPEDAREADQKRYAHIRRLMKEKKEREAETEKRKKRGLFF